jgi:hypothetical protein
MEYLKTLSLCFELPGTNILIDFIWMERKAWAPTTFKKSIELFI